MFRALGGLIMALAITHSTPSDASFSAAGAAAWTANHTITGLAAVATSGAYADLTGTPTIITLQQVYPVGSVYIETLGVNPATTFGFGTWAAKGQGKVLVGYSTGNADFGTTGQTGGATGTSFTPSGTNSTVSFTPSGTNAVSLFREAAAGTNAASAVTGSVSVDWPTGVPTFQGTAVTASASVNWPAGVPTFSGTAHQHGLPIIHSVTMKVAFVSSVWGEGTVTVPNVRITATGSATMAAVMIADGSSSGAVSLSQTTTAAGAVAWPASVPQAVASSSAAGIISWPASVPPAVAKTLTAAAQTFTGVTGSVSAQVFTGVAGTIPAQTFTGVTKTIGVMNPYIVVFFWERTA